MLLRSLSASLVGAALVFPSIATSDDAVSVALYPIQVHSATDESGYLSRGFADMLSSRLERSGRVRVIRLESNAKLPQQQQGVAQEAGRAAGAEYVVFGSYTQFGDGASLDLRCAPVDGGAEDVRHVFIQSGSPGEIIPKLDGVSERIVRFLTGPPAAQADVAEVAAPASNTESLSDLEGRVSALEQVVFGEPAKPDAEAAASE